jgi:hypothetical protein
VAKGCHVSLVLRRWSTVPKRPAVYAMYGGWPPRLWVAYVGIASNLNRRLDQHFVRRDSSVATGVAAAAINPDAVRLVRWWEDERFSETDGLHAGELVAFDFFDPALRSRGAPRQGAVDRANDPAFHADMERLFAGSPAGEFQLPWLWDIDTRLEQMEQRLAALEVRVGH